MGNYPNNYGGKRMTHIVFDGSNILVDRKFYRDGMSAPLEKRKLRVLDTGEEHWFFAFCGLAQACEYGEQSIIRKVFPSDKPMPNVTDEMTAYDGLSGLLIKVPYLDETKPNRVDWYPHPKVFLVDYHGNEVQVNLDGDRCIAVGAMYNVIESAYFTTKSILYNEDYCENYNGENILQEVVKLALKGTDYDQSGFSMDFLNIYHKKDSPCLLEYKVCQP